MAGLVPAIHEGVAASRAMPQYPEVYGAAWIYILTNRPNGILYIGVTSDLAKRIWGHREGVVEAFTKRYGLKTLVYVERHADILTAIQREKNMKHWPRRWKVRLVLASNPNWDDLYDQIL
jgi:putative endonuclease